MDRPGFPLSYGISSALMCKVLCFGIGAAVAAVAAVAIPLPVQLGASGEAARRRTL